MIRQDPQKGQIADLISEFSSSPDKDSESTQQRTIVSLAHICVSIGGEDLDYEDDIVDFCERTGIDITSAAGWFDNAFYGDTLGQCWTQQQTDPYLPPPDIFKFEKYVELYGLGCYLQEANGIFEDFFLPQVRVGKLLGVSQPTVSNIISHFLKKGVWQETNGNYSYAGKKKKCKQYRIVDRNPRKASDVAPRTSTSYDYESVSQEKPRPPHIPPREQPAQPSSGLSKIREIDSKRDPSMSRPR